MNTNTHTFPAKPAAAASARIRKPASMKTLAVRLLTPLLVAALLAPAAGCTDPNAARRQALTSQLQQADSSFALANQAVAERQRKLALLDQQVMQTRAEITDYRAKVEAYMGNHKLAIAAIAAGFGGTRILADDSNAFSDSAKGMAAIATFIALAYAFTHMDEIAEVTDTLTRADRDVKQLESKLSTQIQARDGERAQLAQEQTALLQASAETDRLRTELQALN